MTPWQVSCHPSRYGIVVFPVGGIWKFMGIQEGHHHWELLLVFSAKKTRYAQCPAMSETVFQNGLFFPKMLVASLFRKVGTES